jgi:hypothetical protein
MCNQWMLLGQTDDAADIVIVSAEEMISGDGEIIDSIASVDESASTGEWHQPFESPVATARRLSRDSAKKDLSIPCGSQIEKRVFRFSDSTGDGAANLAVFI